MLTRNTKMIIFSISSFTFSVLSHDSSRAERRAFLPVSSLHPWMSVWSGVKRSAGMPFLFIPRQSPTVKDTMSLLFTLGDFSFSLLFILVACFFSLISLRKVA
jgi:hypothetical protein